MTMKERINFLEKENIALLEVLKFASKYVGKGLAEGAYEGCVVSGEIALERIEEFIDADSRKKILIEVDIKAMKRLL